MLLTSKGVTKDVDPKLCVSCKGRLMCGLPTCPILDKITTIKKIDEKVTKNHFEGPTPPSVFIGRSNYPDVFAGPLSTPVTDEDVSLLDDPSRWYGLPQDDIIRYRESLVSSREKERVNQAGNPSNFVQDLQEIAMSKKFVELDIELYGKPKYNFKVNENSAPMGPTGKLREMTLTENPRIPRKIDKVASDTDLKAAPGIKYLYEKGVDVYKLSNILSVGTLGVKNNRKLVPTRWSITAIDSMLSEEAIKEIKDYPVASEFQVFRSKFLDNNFLIILLPMTWAFEQLEAWVPGSNWNPGNEMIIIKDFELGKKRTTYAENVTGAYYACRLAVCEYLQVEKKQAGALIIREIGSDYKIPLGVWQCRENVRQAMTKKPLRFNSEELLWKFIESRLSTNLKDWKKESEVLRFYKTQRRLFEYF